MREAVGILAYGSVIGDPREEIARACVRIKEGIETPFNVEFARKSTKRGGAPTLVPVDKGGSQVVGALFVLDLPESEAASCLWRREINGVGSGRTYIAPKAIGENTVEIRRIVDFAGVDVVLYAHICANITPLTAGNLASLAIESVSAAEQGRDGISYLIEAKRSGIKTALSADYEAEILLRTGCAELHEALVTLRAANVR
jgi:hypothetical protein